MKTYFFPLLLTFVGCAPVPKVSVPPVAPPAPKAVTPSPQFEKTFGEISIGKSASLLLRYKSISILVDPDYDAPAVAALSPQLDYLFLTDAASQHFSSGARSALRKNMKVIAPSEEADKVKKEGFAEVKALAPGQRILLKKNDDFVFVSAAQSRNPETKLQVNSYLLEFDNGRNLFISGEARDVDTLRQLVYSLRDDGKEIYIGFFDFPSAGETPAAQMMALLQPKNAVLLQTDAAKVNEPALRDALKNELFDGAFLVARVGETVPF